MKIQYILFSIVLFISSIGSLSAQEIQKVIIPVQNGKVLFSDTIAVNNSSDVLYAKIEKWLVSYLSVRRGSIVKNDRENKQLIFRVQDYMEIEKKTLSIFAIYIKYVINITYKADVCIIEIGDIQYVEPEQLEKEKPYVMEGEDVLLKNNYKVFFVTEASEKVKISTKDNFDKLFKSFRDSLKD